MSYSAIVCRISVRPHPKADRLQLGTAYGNQVVIDLDVKDGELGIFFPCDGELSEEFCRLNDLFPRFDDQNRRIGGGFFDPRNRRVRAQSFRGEKSDGFWCPLSYLRSMFFDEVVNNLKDGDQFTCLDGREICRKYETEKTVQAAARAQKQGTPKKNSFFKEHVDTKQFSYESKKIPVGSVVHLSEKLHGTSARYGFFEECELLTGWRKWLYAFCGLFAGFVGLPVSTAQRKLLVGSRRVQLKSVTSETSFYGDEGFRFAVTKKLNGNMRPGETIYGELVGYQKWESPIMGTVSTAGLQDKEFKKIYGDSITYKYGCTVGTSRFFVYRITKTDQDGHVVELSVEQVKARCKVLELDYVPEFSGPLVVMPGSDRLETMGISFPLVTGGEAGHLQSLEKMVEGLLKGPSTLDTSHIREGVVIRIDNPDGSTSFLKAKSHEFKVLEGIIKDQEGYIDAEEAS